VNWQVISSNSFFTVALPIVIALIVAMVTQNKRIDDLRDSMNKRFDAVDRRLDRMDHRLDGIDQRLAAIEAKLSTERELPNSKGRRWFVAERGGEPILRQT